MKTRAFVTIASLLLASCHRQELKPSEAASRKIDQSALDESRRAAEDYFKAFKAQQSAEARVTLYGHLANDPLSPSLIAEYQAEYKNALEKRAKADSDATGKKKRFETLRADQTSCTKVEQFIAEIKSRRIAADAATAAVRQSKGSSESQAKSLKADKEYGDVFRKEFNQL